MLTLPRRGSGTDTIGPVSAAMALVGRAVGRLGRWIASGGFSSFIAVAGVTAFVIAELRPDLLFAQTMDVGGDNAAHVVAVNYFVHHLINHGELSGWDPQWFGGFPLYVFYFPLPPTLVAFLSLFFSYAVSFKLVTVLGSVLTPVAAYTFGKLANFEQPVPALMSVAMLPFLFNTSYTIDGGDIVSTMAGEFSFSLALALALFFLGVFCYALRSGRLRWLAALLFALTLLSHVVPALFAGATACLIALTSTRRYTKMARSELVSGGALVGIGRLRRVHLLLRARIPQPFLVLATTGFIGALLASFWLMPFGIYLGYAASMGYQRVQGIVANFLPGPADDAVCALAAVGVVLAVVFRRRVAIALTVAAVLSVGAFSLLPDGLVYNARWLPFWSLLTCLLAAYALGELGRLAFGASARVHWAGVVTPLVIGLTSLAVTAAYAGVLPGYYTPVGARIETPSWVQFNYTGYQGKPDWGEFQQLTAMLKRVAKVHGCGRLDYEYSPNTTNGFGSTLVPMSFPLWTNGCIQPMEGVYYESSSAIYYHFLDQAELSLDPSNPVANLPYGTLNVADGIRHLQLEGVKYFLASSPTVEEQAAADPALVAVGSSPETADVVDRPPGSSQPPLSSSFNFVLYEIKNAPVVTPLHFKPIVEHLSRTQWKSTSIAWFQNESAWSVEIANSGPLGWPVYAPGTTVPAKDAIRVPATKVTHVRMGNQQISFDVKRTGVPVMVTIPYFPNWQAHGAAGPYEVTPDFMAVVPRQHHVVLDYGTTTVDWAGRFGSLFGILGTLALAGSVPPVAPVPPPGRQRRPADTAQDAEPEATAKAAPDSATSGEGDDNEDDDEDEPAAQRRARTDGIDEELGA